MFASTLERHHLAGFRQRLEVRATHLRRKIAAVHGGAVAALADTVHDTKDHASAVAADQLSLADLARDRAELADVEMALARMDVGSYGVCCDCGKDIGRRRLDAYPTAKRCHDCQEVYERRNHRLRGA